MEDFLTKRFPANHFPTNPWVFFKFWFWMGSGQSTFTAFGAKKNQLL